jgi:hypothetical protein
LHHYGGGGVGWERRATMRHQPLALSPSNLNSEPFRAGQVYALLCGTGRGGGRLGTRRGGESFCFPQYFEGRQQLGAARWRGGDGGRVGAAGLAPGTAAVLLLLRHARGVLGRGAAALCSVRMLRRSRVHTHTPPKLGLVDVLSEISSQSAFLWRGLA